MRSSKRVLGALGLLAAPALFTLPCLAETLVVDDDGGAGGFTSIQAALDAAVDGDVVLVQSGSYGPFVLSKGVGLIGSAPPEFPFPVEVSGSCRIEGLAAGSVARVSSLRFTQTLFVADNEGLVVLDRIAGRAVDVANCFDVRVDRFDGGFGSGGTSRVADARVELVESALYGARGQDASCLTGGDGGPALEARTGARLHLARTSLFGGEGGSVACSLFDGGDGGSALWVDDDAQVLLTGGLGTTVRGGDGGLGGNCPDDGDGGPAVLLSGGVLRYSFVALEAGESCQPLYQPTVIDNTGGVVQQLSPIGPTLGYTGSAGPGDPVAFDLFASPGALVLVFFGSAPTQLAYPGSLLGVLTTAELGFLAGVTSAETASVAFPVQFPPQLAPGTWLPTQGLALDPSGSIGLTNSLPTLVR